MDVTIEPSPLRGTVPAVASKSIAHRLLILAALSPSTCDVDCNTTSQDIEATVGCLNALGARIARTRVGFRVRPIPRDPQTGLPRANEDATLDCGESGSTLRFMLPIACALGSGASLEGHGRLAERPLSPLYEELVSHGASLSPQGTLPLRVSGRLEGGTFRIAGNVSSQYVSGLLMAAPLLGGHVRVLVSRPVESHSYITMTVRALKSFGAVVSETHVVDGGTPCIAYDVIGATLSSPHQVKVEGDWSNSAFWLAAGAMEGPVTVTGLDQASPQGDRAILAALALYGAQVRREGSAATTRTDDLSPRTVDVRDTPDLVPPLAAVAAFAKGETRIVHAERLRLKESDRLETVRAALAAMGASVEVTDDGLAIRGTGSLSGGVVDAANDHRIAMMAAVCAAHAQAPTTIHGAECVRKSYPTFFDDFRSLGGIAHESE